MIAYITVAVPSICQFPTHVIKKLFSRVFVSWIILGGLRKSSRLVTRSTMWFSVQRHLSNSMETSRKSFFDNHILSFFFSYEIILLLCRYYAYQWIANSGVSHTHERSHRSPNQPRWRWRSASTWTTIDILRIQFFPWWSRESQRSLW